MNLNYNVLNIGFKIKRKKFGIGELIFLVLFGGAFTGAGFLAINGLKVDFGWARTYGEVVSSSSKISDGSTTHTPVVRYSVDGQEYWITSSISSGFAPTIGEKREVAYNPDQPNQAKIVEGIGTMWWLWLFPISGVIILVIAPISFILSLRRSSTINNLVQKGMKLQGILSDIQSSGNNNGSYKIIVSAPDSTGTVHNYISDSLDGVAGLSLTNFQNNPIPIDVYIDPANPQNYYVDISGIPNLTPQRISELIQSAIKGKQPKSILDTQQTIDTNKNTQPPISKL